MAANSDRRHLPHYAIRAVKGRTVDLAQRYAVLAPLVARGTRAGTQQQIIRRMDRLRSMWIARCTALREAGWERLQTGKQWLYIAGCPPFSVMVDGPAFKPCKNTAICPFCWARNVVKETFERLEHACYVDLQGGIGPKETQKRRLASLDIVEMEYRFSLARTEELLRELLRGIPKLGKGRVKELLPTALGAYCRFTIEPETNRKGRLVWVVRQRMLAIIQAQDESPDGFRKKRGRLTVRRTHGISRRKLALAVGRTCRYPVWMMNGPAEAVQSVLTAGGEGGRGKAPRLGAYYGLLRHRSG